MYRNLNQLALGTFFFLHTVCMPVNKWPKWPDLGTTGQTRGPSNAAVIFCNAGFSAGLRSCWIVTS